MSETEVTNQSRAAQHLLRLKRGYVLRMDGLETG